MSSSTTICSNSCSARVSVIAANTCGLDAILVAWSLVMSAVRTWVMAATICSGAASVRMSRICSSCSSVTGSSAGISMTVSGRVVGDESVSFNSVIYALLRGQSFFFNYHLLLLCLLFQGKICLIGSGLS